MDFSDSGSEYIPESDNLHSDSTSDSDVNEDDIIKIQCQSSTLLTNLSNDECITTKTKVKQGRKRKSDPCSWKRAVNKLKRSKGEQYINRNGNVVKNKVYQNIDCKCKQSCSQSVSNEDRETIFKSFYELADNGKQNIYIRGLVQENAIKQRRPRNLSGKPKTKSLKYFLITPAGSVKVCKKFLIDTFQISDARLYNCCRNHEISSIIDKRGKKEPPNKIDTSKVEEHIKSFPCYKSHYSRSDNPNRRYLRSDLTIHKMFTLYLEYCEKENIEPVKEKMYYHVFTSKFNLHFKPPSKDTCQLCDSLEQTILHGPNEDLQNKAKIEKELHLRKSKSARDSLKLDQSLASNSDSVYVFTFDLEKALAFPKLSCSVAYYKTNMYMYNLGVHSFNNNTGYMYMWDEVTGSRGSQEIASCLVKHLKKYAANYSSIIMFSDSCTGQNRNIKLALSLLKLVCSPEMRAEYIDHKFLVSGHSYLPNDADFGVIETKAKKKQFIYGPEDWIELVKTAKNKNNFEVIEMNRNEFKSTKALENVINKKKQTVDGIKVNWLKIRWLRYYKNTPNKIFYKETLQNDIEFNAIDITKGRKGKLINWSIVDQNSLYDTPRDVKPMKKKHMLELLKFIPPMYHAYYKKLPSEKIKTRSRNAIDDSENSESSEDFCD